MPAIFRQILSRMTSDRRRIDRSRFRRLRPNLVMLEDRITPTNVTVASLNPSVGPTIGGTEVTIMGTGFTNVTAVDFGPNNPAINFSVAGNGTSLTAFSPAGTGTVDVTVTTPGGASATSDDDLFTYAPTVSSISPSAGPLDGGTLVTITGTGFTASAGVEFGTTMATNVTVVSNTTITASSPPGTGTLGVTVTTSSGTSAISPADVFTYVPAPTVDGLSPTKGPLGGGTLVTITGTGFDGATAVVFGTSPATDVTVVSDTTVTAECPAGTGMPDVTVTTPGGMSAPNSAYQFNYVPAPAVSGLSVIGSTAPSGPTAGGTMVTINGTGFTGATAVDFGNNSAMILSISSSGTSLTAVSPAGTSGPVDVTVTAAGGTSATSIGDLFTYVAVPAAAPKVTGISPIVGSVSGGTVVTIMGTNLGEPMVIEFGTVPVTSVISVTATQIVVFSPPATSAGPINVSVATLAGTSAISSADSFFYFSNAAITPTVSGINLPAGPPSGGTLVTITGTGFTTGTAVEFGTTMATNVTICSATKITADSPAGTGNVDVTVITPGGQSAPSAAVVFSYVGDGPEVLSVQTREQHAQPTGLLIYLNGPLDPFPAQKVSNYQIVGPSGHRIKVRSARYFSNTVTLRLAGRLNLRKSYRLTINGTPPSGLTNQAGNLFLDGASIGQPGSNYVMPFTRSNQSRMVKISDLLPTSHLAVFVKGSSDPPA